MQIMANPKPCKMKPRTIVKSCGFQKQMVLKNLKSKVIDAMAAMMLMTINFMDPTIKFTTF